jgi:hypothetical protein
MTRRFGAVAALVSLAAMAACGAPLGEDGGDPEGLATALPLFDCNDPAQRLTCNAPADPSKRFVCHGTSSDSHPYIKIGVLLDSSHVPGVTHPGGSRADQAPGASADDVGSGSGLDCECNVRICDGVCSGAAAGSECDDGDKCTNAGTCAGDECAPGPASCTDGAVVDACNVQNGTCDAETGACGIDALPAGTPCAPGLVCDDGGGCTGVPLVVVNEVESSGGMPGDWVELFNAGTGAADVSGWKFLDNDDTHVAYVIPAGTVVPVGGYLVLNEASFGFGLGGADSARLFDAGGNPVDSYAWTSHAVTTYGRCPNGTGTFRNTNGATKGAANDCTIAVKINEVESSGGTPGDWAELFNAGPIGIDLSGWVFKDNDDTHAYVLPAGTTIAAGAYLVLDEAVFGFGLGSADSARLFDAAATVIDSHSWTAHAATTYARCPNGTGPFETSAGATKGAVNSCSGGPSGAVAWPGQNAVATVDGTSVFGGNLSGIFYEGGAPNVIWAVRNGPSTLYRLAHDGTIWTPQAGGWDTGKTLRYPNGTGSPDAEDVTKAELSSPAVYVATERDNDASGVSRLSILRFDSSDAAAELNATHEWNLTADLPAVGANIGLEAITWIPDTFLVAHAFFDTSAGHAYNPSEYPGHGTGLFFVGVEATGQIHAYALNHDTGGFTRLTSFASGDATTKALSFDRDVGYLWTSCGSACANQTAVMVIDGNMASPTFGAFHVIRQFARPTTMENLANEGIAIAPESQCVSGSKAFFWTDDGETNGHSLRADTIPCGPFVP